jgi:ATP-binding cassette subfamily F protein 3
VIAVNNLSIHFGGTFLFDNISFIINDKEKVGLVGKNGAGKSTLLKILSHLQNPHEGNVSITLGHTIGYLPQEMRITTNKTVYDETLNAFSEVLQIEKKIQELTEILSDRTDYESEEYFNLIHQITEANERLNIIGANTIAANTEKILLGLGFKKDEFTRNVSELSGGWQMRIELAKILLKRPDIILLDEPTNHLDIESIQWLEDFLISYNGIVVLVSHDRTFLDNVTQRTIEISLGKIYDYNVSYSNYIALRKERIEILKATYENQQKQIAETEKFIERFRYKATKARQVQSRIKALNKLDIIEVEDEDLTSIHFKFPPAPHAGKVIIEAINISKYFGDKLILNNVNFSVIN